MAPVSGSVDTFNIRLCVLACTPDTMFMVEPFWRINVIHILLLPMPQLVPSVLSVKPAGQRNLSFKVFDI
jgi:hypothetical protein